MWEVWLLVAIIFTVAGFFYKKLFLLWFLIGALVAFVSSLLLHHVLIETIIFLSISLILLLTLTRYLTRKLTPQKVHTTTNTDKLIGHHGIVIKSIGQTHLESGLVKLDGEIWSAVSASNDAISVGSLVEVQCIRGVRLTVINTTK